MKRWVWRIILLFDFILLIAFAWLWLRSASVSDVISWARPESPSGYWEFIGRSELCALRFTLYNSAKSPAHPDSPWRWQRGWDYSSEPVMFYLFDSTAKPTFSDYFWQLNGGDWWQKLRFDASYIAPSQYGYSQWSISVPNWFLMVICGLPLLLQMGLRIRRTRRRGKGLCPTCGYDLRVSQGRCPECGAPTPEGMKHEAHEGPRSVS